MTSWSNEGTLDLADLTIKQSVSIILSNNMEDFKNFDLMRRYALGNMLPGERTDFEQRLAHDPELSSEWQDYRLIADAVTDNQQGSSDLNEALRAAQDELRAEGFFDEIHSQIRREMAAQHEAERIQTVRPRARLIALPRYAWLAAAASVALLLAAWLFWPRPDAFDLQASLRIPPTSVGYSERDTSALMCQMLQEGQAEEVIQLYRRSTGQEIAEIKLYYGLAWLQKDEYSKALSIFEQIMNNPNTQFQTEYQARYYAARCYFLLGEKAKWRAALEKVADDRAKGDGQKSNMAERAAANLGR